MLRGAEVLRLQAELAEGGGRRAALPAHEEQLRVHQEEDLPAHPPAGTGKTASSALADRKRRSPTGEEKLQVDPQNVLLPLRSSSQ